MFNEYFNSTEESVQSCDLKLEDSWGLAVNVGIGYQVKDNGFFGPYGDSRL
ncbi:OmpW family outer membrane protein [Photobacterium sp. DNB22_13_2]